MNLNYCLAYLVIYMVEPVLWAQIFDKVFKQKYERKCYYIVFFAVIYSSIVLKQYVNLTGKSEALVLSYMPYLFLLLFMGLFILYETNYIQRFVCIAILFIFSIIADEMALFMGRILLKIQGNVIKLFGWGNLLVTIMARLFSVLFYFVFFIFLENKSSKKISGKEILYMIIPNLIINYLVFVCSRYSETAYGKDTIVCVAVIIDILYAIYCLGYLLKRLGEEKKQLQREMNERLYKMEQELSLYSQIEETMNELRKLRHDMKSHFEIVNELCENQKCQEVHNYLEGLYKDIEKANDIYLIQR